MFRYVGLLWDGNSTSGTNTARILAQRLRESSEGWECVLDNVGLMVFATGIRSASGVCRLADRAGVVVGTIFEKGRPASDSPPRRVERFDQRATLSVLDSSGLDLVSAYWGRYVAFLFDARQSKRWVICGPVNTLPCNLTQHKGVSLVYSRLADCQKLTRQRFTVNLKQLAIRVCTGLERADTSLLNEVSTVYSGECIEFTSKRSSRTYYWHPQKVATTDVIESVDEAADALRAATKSCVRAWGNCYDSVLHLLSGGLDSSMVIACLASELHEPKITCVNLWSALDGSSDEREYARLAAARAGVPLIEQERLGHIDGRDVLRFTPQASPIDTILWSLEMMPALRPIANRVGAAAIFSGNHGDDIFCNSKIQLIGIDYVRRHGIRRELFALLMKISAHRTQTVWSLLRSALWYGHFPDRWDAMPEIISPRQLVPSDLSMTMISDPRILAPWLSSSRQLPPGKVMHILSLLSPSLYYNPLAAPADPETTDPLYSQPLVEQCLRIPTYIHTHGGRRRSAIRRALEPDMPSEIARRYWKGGISRHSKSLLPENLAFYRELLLDGALVKHGLLDRRRVEDALSGEPSKSTVHTTEVTDYVCIEAWLGCFTMSQPESQQELLHSHAVA